VLVSRQYVRFYDILTEDCVLMTVTVFCILLFAALLHASWNAIVKAGSDKLYSAICVSGSAALIALVMLAFLTATLARQRALSRRFLCYRLSIRYWSLKRIRFPI
jgi:hypothetical protein